MFKNKKKNFWVTKVSKITYCLFLFTFVPWQPDQRLTLLEHHLRVNFIAK